PGLAGPEPGPALTTPTTRFGPTARPPGPAATELSTPPLIATTRPRRFNISVSWLRTASAIAWTSASASIRSHASAGRTSVFVLMTTRMVDSDRLSVVPGGAGSVPHACPAHAHLIPAPPRLVFHAALLRRLRVDPWSVAIAQRPRSVRRCGTATPARRDLRRIVAAERHEPAGSVALQVPSRHASRLALAVNCHNERECRRADPVERRHLMTVDGTVGGNVASMLWQTADRRPEHVAVVEPDRVATYGQLRGRAAAIASALAGRGIGPG